uniref:protein-tyrosine-phosphatase n=1 Tax=Knipowitschia caucasica TaxID=637954 RepID=A0AAV2K9P4_KNICA
MVVGKTTKRTLYRERRQGDGWAEAADDGRQTEVSFPVWKRQGARSLAASAAATGRRAAASPQERTRGGDTATMARSPKHVMLKRSRDHAGRTMCEAMGAGRTGCYIVLDVMLDMAECEGVVDIYNCVKTLCSRRINMIQTEEQYVFIHDAILEACLCGETAIPVSEFSPTYKELLKVDSQSNTSQLREEFQTLNSVTPHLDVEECSISLMPRNREKNRSMDVLPPDRSLAFLVTTEGESSNYINAALADSFLRPAAFVVTPHPLPGTTTDFWRLVYDYGCTSIVMLNQLNQSNSAWPCLQYWPEPGLQQFGPMTVELLSRTEHDDVIIRLFRVQNITRIQEGQLVVRHFQFLRWSPYRDIPDSKKAFLSLLAQVHNWQRECGEGRTVVHCLNGGGRSGTFSACTMILEMIRHHSMVDVFFAAKTLRNSKPNMVETMEQYRFCYELAQEYLDCLEAR